MSSYLFFSRLIQDIIAEKIPPRQGRHNPRVVKKTRSEFPNKKPIHRETSVSSKKPNFAIFNSV
ncbi:hypothetical protein I4641_22735 [Waterburya agarophytonicola K14]|uniref:Uncharacterized protein n=1 Tax=Waterburya agarophytonicola KI4 TaxID=2874699 RepID=A0A964BZN8_9CYAN|nr:hypothetical protein [Waterburya agarophytonicola KI4]